MSNKYAIIENGKVVNTVVADDEFAAEQGWVLLTGDAGKDWEYVNGQFIDSRPVLVETTESTPEPTKEELLAQLNALAAQIQSLG